MRVIETFILSAFLCCAAVPGYAEIITYNFTGTITSITTNQNNVIPNLNVGDTFSGYTKFESTGWDQTSGTMFVSLNGVNLLFAGSNIYGGVTQNPNRYSLRIAADNLGNNPGSTFNAFNFGPELVDSNGSAGITQPFPASLNLQEFETNTFLIAGTYVPSNSQVGLTGRLDTFTIAVPEPSSIVALAAGLAACYAKRRRLSKLVRA